ncbi:hypothetical protein ACIXC0_17045 [Bacteroides fragilis]
MYYINIYKIAHFGICIGGINLQCAPLCLRPCESVKEIVLESSASGIGDSSTFFLASSSTRLRLSSRSRFSLFSRRTIIMLIFLQKYTSEW